MKDQVFLDQRQVAERLGLCEDGFAELVSRGIFRAPKDGELWSAERVDARLLTLQKAAMRCGLVYVVGFGQYVKIGFTQTPIEVRIASIQSDCPEILKIYGQIEGTHFDEIRLLGRFIEYRSQGEWHYRRGDLAAWIDAGCPR